MLSIPDRLFQLQSVTTLLRQPGKVLLQKRLSASMVGKESYLAMHALSMVIRGSQRVTADDGSVMTINAGTIGFLPKGMYTIADFVTEDEGFETLILFLSEEELENMLPETNTRQSRLNAAGFFEVKTPVTIQHWQQSVIGISNLENPRISHLLSLKIQEVIELLSIQRPDLMSRLRSMRPSSRASLREFMEHHFDKPLTVRDYAYLTGKSESSFRREFKLKFGTSPLSWIKEKRLQKAQSLLSASGTAISDVSLQVGYENVSHFIAEYKKKFGSTPGQHR